MLPSAASTVSALPPPSVRYAIRVDAGPLGPRTKRIEAAKRLARPNAPLLCSRCLPLRFPVVLLRCASSRARCLEASACRPRCSGTASSSSTRSRSRSPCWQTSRASGRLWCVPLQSSSCPLGRGLTPSRRQRLDSKSRDEFVADCKTKYDGVRAIYRHFKGLSTKVRSAVSHAC